MKTVAGVFDFYSQRNPRQQAAAAQYNGRVVAMSLNSGSGTGARMDSVKEILVKLPDGTFREFHFRFFDKAKDGTPYPLEVRTIDRADAENFCYHAYIVYDVGGNWIQDLNAVAIADTVDAI